MGGFVMPGDEPFARIHFSADAPIQFHALLYVPGRAPADLFQEDRKALQLFARRVLVIENCDTLLPQYLRFVRGVVDSEDLPLNVSREMLQENKSLAAIRRQLTRKVLKQLADLAEQDADKYAKLWAEFGSVIKEGLHLDQGHRDELTKLLRWRSAGQADTLLGLTQYVASMPEGQSVIYYIAGPDEQALRNSPHLEGIRAKGYDVLLMSDPVDEWVGPPQIQRQAAALGHPGRPRHPREARGQAGRQQDRHRPRPRGRPRPARREGQGRPRQQAPA